MPADSFASPYVDVDEWREAPHPHHYVHGGFAGTDTRFSVYFPPPAEYGDRFITVVEGGQAGHEVRAAKLTGDALPSIAWAFSCGAFLVEFEWWAHRERGGCADPGPARHPGHCVRSHSRRDPLCPRACDATVWTAASLRLRHRWQRWRSCARRAREHPGHLGRRGAVHQRCRARHQHAFGALERCTRAGWRHRQRRVGLRTGR